MEQQNLPIKAKKFRNIIRALYLVLRKEISKGKLLFDLNMALNHTKIANKLSTINVHVMKNDEDGDGDFLSFYPNTRKLHVATPSYNDTWIASPVELCNTERESSNVKQVRISDSPISLREFDQDYSIHVDEAAEEFIMKFYQNLREQQ